MRGLTRVCRLKFEWKQKEACFHVGRGDVKAQDYEAT